MEKLNELMSKACLASEMGKKGITVDLQMLSQIRDEFWAVEKRAEAAEAKPAEQKEQKADFHVRQVQTEHGRAWVECGADYERGRHFFTRPASAINLAELAPEGWKLVPVEPSWEMISAAIKNHEGDAFLPVSLYKTMLAAAPTPHDQAYTPHRRASPCHTT